MGSAAEPAIVMRVREGVRRLLMKFRIFYLGGIWGHDVHPTARISFSAYLDRTNPKSISIGAYTIVTRGAIVLSHDYARSIGGKTIVGRNCLIGVNAIIMSGITIGDEVVVGAGAVVTRDVPSNSLVIGNPAKIVNHIKTDVYGRILQKTITDHIS